MMKLYDGGLIKMVEEKKLAELLKNITCPALNGSIR